MDILQIRFLGIILFRFMDQIIHAKTCPYFKHDPCLFADALKVASIPMGLVGICRIATHGFLASHGLHQSARQRDSQ